MRKRESVECPAGSGAVDERLFTPYSDCEECDEMFEEHELQQHESGEYCPKCYEKVKAECEANNY